MTTLITSMKDTKQGKDEVHDEGNEDNENMQSINIAAAASSSVYDKYDCYFLKESVYDSLMFLKERKEWFELKTLISMNKKQ